ncbi:MAG: FtsX-like permease family protein [Anaerolineae bacterium]|nr:FtsX-like permease family protein [Anaerolineae bacterium]
MISTRWYKIVNDLWNNKARTILVVMAIAVGVFAFGGVMASGEVMLRNMNEQWQASVPASILFSLPEFDTALVNSVRQLDNVRDAEGRTDTYLKLIAADGQQHNLQLTVFQDYEDIRVARLYPQEGTFPPGRHEILLERTTATFLGVKLGDTITLEKANGKRYDLIFTGTVHAYDVVPPALYPYTYGYVSTSTLRWLGYSGRYNTLAIAADPAITSIEEINSIASGLREHLQANGYTVYSTSIQEPNKHWGASITEGVTAVLGVIGVLSLGLSGFLVVSTITSLLMQQQRQIGIMKAVGGSRQQIAGLYLSMATVFGALALVIALPAGAAMAYWFVKIISNYLNFDVEFFYIPHQVLAMEVFAALLVPLIAALFPVLGGTRVTVRETLSDYGIAQTSRQGLIDRMLAKMRGVPRPTLISLGNTFRRKGRLLLALGTLTVAGATFISVINVRTSMMSELQVVLDLFKYDVGISLDGAYYFQQLKVAAREVPGVTYLEGWAFGRVQRIHPDGEEGPTFSLIAPPADSPFLVPTMSEGRWLEPGDRNAIVIASTLLRVEPGINVGDVIETNINGASYEWEVVGIVKSFGNGGSFAYVPYEYYSQIQGTKGLAYSLYVMTDQHDMAYQKQIAEALKESFDKRGIGVGQVETMGEVIQANTGQIDFLIYFLVLLSSLIGIVGGLGLMSTMSLNVLERTREIGVMRAIGAQNGALRSIVVTEGLVIGVLSWILSIAGSIPLSAVMAYGVGVAVFQSPMAAAFSPVGIVAWLVLIVIIATVASLLPARRAARISIREALAYE